MDVTENTTDDNATFDDKSEITTDNDIDEFKPTTEDDATSAHDNLLDYDNNCDNDLYVLLNGGEA